MASTSTTQSEDSGKWDRSSMITVSEQSEEIVAEVREYDTGDTTEVGRLFRYFISAFRTSD